MAKATAVRNIRDDHQKAFLKIFNSLCGRFNRWQVWQDFVMVTAIEISNATDKQNAPERTKTYQTIISKYSDAEQNKFAELLAEVIMGMEQNPDQDFLGELYMLCELGNDASGQFFTPYDVCRCMVEISGGSDPAAENDGFFSVSDPACGAGALLIAFANLCRRKNICYHDKVLFVAQDIDLIAGLSSKEIAVTYIKSVTHADGIISTKPGVIREAKEEGLFAIMRFFVIDSIAFDSIQKQTESVRPDMIEVLPGVMPKIIRRICRESRVPVIAGGLIADKEDIMAALDAGAVSISTTRQDVWFM